MRLTGIIDYTMDNFLCVRGFASMIDLAQISQADESIQRELIEEHKGEMEAFLTSGKFTFFPEVILCANMNGSEEDSIAINDFREKIQLESGVIKAKINDIKYSVKRNAVKKENNDMAFDVTQTVILEFDIKDIEKNKLFRIDGNHRLSAVQENSTYANKRIPYCLLLFRDEEETNKFCRALFYNINTKQIPLKMEENLKVIIESDKAFDDDTLKNDPSFGFNYFLTREVLRKIDLSDYPFLKTFISGNKFTYFVEVFNLLEKNELIENSENAIDKVSKIIKDIDEALRDASLAKIPNNFAFISAFSYYKLEDGKKANHFMKWASKNSITEIKNLNISDLISIYDKIYENSPKKVFMSMWYNKKTKDTYAMVKDVKEILKRENNIELQIIKVDEHKDGYSDNIYDRILKGIRESDLLIADVSYSNKNVHHEIGYAQGLGKEVLLLYKNEEDKDSSKEIGSNLSMHDQLRFDAVSELRTELLKRIKDFFEIIY